MRLRNNKTILDIIDNSDYEYIKKKYNLDISLAQLKKNEEI